MRASTLRGSAKRAIQCLRKTSAAPVSIHPFISCETVSAEAAHCYLGSNIGRSRSFSRVAADVYAEHGSSYRQVGVKDLQTLHHPFSMVRQTLPANVGPVSDTLRASADCEVLFSGDARETTADLLYSRDRGSAFVDRAVSTEWQSATAKHIDRQQDDAAHEHIAFTTRQQRIVHNDGSSLQGELESDKWSVRSGAGGYCSTPLQLWRTKHGPLLIDRMHVAKQSCKGMSTKAAEIPVIDHDAHSKRAVTIALLCNALVFSMKLGVYLVTRSSVMLAEAVHSLADLGNQGLLAYGLLSSKRAPDKAHPYGYTKERFVWALISATGIFCLGSGLTVAHGIQSLYHPEEVQNVYMAGGVLAASALMEGASFYVAYKAVVAGAKSEKMTFVKYLWRGHDPTAVAVLMEDGAAVTGLGIAAAATAAVHITGNQIYDAIGSIAVGGLLGVVAIILIGRNREALLGRSMDETDVRKVIRFLRQDPVVDAIWDCKSEVIGPGAYRFKAEIDFNGVAVVQNHLNRVGRDAIYQEVRKAVAAGDDAALDRVMGNYGEDLMTALGSEVDRLEREIQRLVPEILHLDIEAHNPLGPTPIERLYANQTEV